MSSFLPHTHAQTHTQSHMFLKNCDLCIVWKQIFVVVQSLSHVQVFATPWTAARQASLSFTVSQNLLRFMSTESTMLSEHFILCHFLFLLPAVFPSIRVFSNELTLYSFRISPSSEYSGLTSFRID